MTGTPAPYASAGISILVPVSNEALSVQQTLNQLVAIMRRLGQPYEILVIDDGSTDASRQAIAAVADPALRVITHRRNQGYGASLTHGLRQARFPQLVITDADGTYPLERIPELLAGLDQHAMVIGARTGQQVHTAAARRLVKWGLHRLAERITGRAIPDLNSGLRAMRRAAILPLEPILPQRFSWTSTVTVALLLGGQAVAFVPIDYHRRQGVSKVHPMRDTLRALGCILRAAAFGAAQRPGVGQDTV